MKKYQLLMSKERASLYSQYINKQLESYDDKLVIVAETKKIMECKRADRDIDQAVVFMQIKNKMNISHTIFALKNKNYSSYHRYIDADKLSSSPLLKCNIN